MIDRKTLKAEQIRAIDHNTGSIIVSASAGSGKTMVMIERLIRLIAENKAKVTDVLAVTFTEKAASEMKEKLRKALTEKINKDKDYRLSAQLSDISSADICTIDSFCARLVRTYFYKAGVSGDFSVADANFADKLKNEAIDKTFREFYDCSDNGFYTAVERYLSARNDSELKRIIKDVYEFNCSEASFDRLFESAKRCYSSDGFELLKKELLSDIKEKVERLSLKADKAYNLYRMKKCDKCCEYVLTLKDEMRAVSGARNIYELKRAEDMVLPRRPSEQKDDEEVGKINRLVTDIKTDFIKIIKEKDGAVTDEETDLLKNAALKKDVEVLERIVKKFDENYSQLKREENVLDFADLERFALKILNDAEALSGIKEKYKYVFVDEYQDVNDVQEEILTKISDDNMFMVGDEKQSIYGFRGCRSEFFTQKFKKMSLGGEAAIKLNYNFRSANAVIEAVNKVFSFCMTEKAYGEDYKGNSELLSGGLYPDSAAGRAVLYFYDKEKTAEKAQKQPAEIYDILAEINKKAKRELAPSSLLVAKIIAEELGKTYFDGKEEKRVRMGDIAVLSRDKQTEYVKRLVDDLAALNIPVATEVKQDVSAFPEVETLICLLKILNGGGDDIPLATVMKSPIGGFTDEELYRIVRCYADFLPKEKRREATFFQAVNYCVENGLTEDGAADKTSGSTSVVATDGTTAGVFAEALNEAADGVKKGVSNFCADGTEDKTTGVASEETAGVSDRALKEKLKEFCDYIALLRALSDFLPAYDILYKVVSDKNLEAFCLSGESGEKKLKRLNFFVSSTVSGEKRYAVSEYLELIEKTPKYLLMTPEEKDDSVKVMTIHASKGLEFPVVIVCGLENKLSARSEQDKILKDRSMGYITRYFDDENKTTSDTVQTAVIKNRLRKERVKEELRLLYVALTRAKYSLALALCRDEEEYEEEFDYAGRFFEYLPQGLTTVLFTDEDMALLTEERNTRKVILGKADERLTSNIIKNLGFEYPYQKDVTLPLKSTVTATLSVKADDEMKKIKAETLFTDEETTAEKGTLAHRFLEFYDFSLGIEQNVDKIIADKTMTKEQLSEINLDKISAAINGGAFDGIKGKKLYREKNFLTTFPARLLGLSDTDTEVLVQGKIDLLADGDDGVTVYDYKYTSLSRERIIERYSKQLDLYAIAVEKCTGKKVVGKYVIDLLTGESIKIEQPIL